MNPTRTPLRILSSVALASLICGVVATSSAGSQDVDAPSMDFEATLLDGGEVSPGDYAGHVVLVDLWATWCDPCLDALPAYAEIFEEHASDGFVVLAISVDGSRRPLERFVERESLPFAVAWDQDHTIVEALAPATMPTSYLIDRSGTVRFVHAGFFGDTARELEAEIELLLAEPDPTAEPEDGSGTEPVDGSGASAPRAGP